MVQKGRWFLACASAADLDLEITAHDSLQEPRARGGRRRSHYT